MSYSYIGFKLGKWDENAGEVVMDPDAKMADVNLRRAMWHAIDNDAVGEHLYKLYEVSVTQEEPILPKK